MDESGETRGSVFCPRIRAGERNTEWRTRCTSWSTDTHVTYQQCNPKKQKALLKVTPSCVGRKTNKQTKKQLMREGVITISVSEEKVLRRSLIWGHCTAHGSREGRWALKQTNKKHTKPPTVMFLRMTVRLDFESGFSYQNYKGRIKSWRC